MSAEYYQNKDCFGNVRKPPNTRTLIALYERRDDDPKLGNRSEEQEQPELQPRESGEAEGKAAQLRRGPKAKKAASLRKPTIEDENAIRDGRW